MCKRVLLIHLKTLMTMHCWKDNCSELWEHLFKSLFSYTLSHNHEETIFWQKFICSVIFVFCFFLDPSIFSVLVWCSSLMLFNVLGTFLAKCALTMGIFSCKISWGNRTDQNRVLSYFNFSHHLNLMKCEHRLYKKNWPNLFLKPLCHPTARHHVTNGPLRQLGHSHPSPVTASYLVLIQVN